MASILDVKSLARQLPADRLTDATRRLIGDALNGGSSPEALLAAVRGAVGELLQQGDLVKVALAGLGSRSQSFYLVRGTSSLLDLSRLLPDGQIETATRPVPEATPEVRKAKTPWPTAREADADRSKLTAAGADVEPRPEPEAVRELDLLSSLLEAMEQAQDLQVGDPRNNESGVLVDRILSLLHRYVPQIALHAQLHGQEPPVADTRFLLPPLEGDGMPFWLRQRRCGQSLWIPYNSTLPAFLRGDDRPGAAERPRETVTAVVPILAPGNLQGEIGLLYVTAPQGWTRDRMFTIAHRLSAFVSRRWHCQHDVNRLVQTDPLTGIHNRAFFDSQFPLELERARRGGLPLTLVLGDLDRFKAVNDAHGHQCGDMVLRSVARQLQATLRRIDHVCRIGGEEFAFLLPCTSSEEAREVLSRFVGRPFSVTLPLELGGGSLSVTMSYGAVTFPAAGNNHSELHRKADSMLYQAKKLGRNRCCLWMPDGPHQMIVASWPPPAGH